MAEADSDPERNHCRLFLKVEYQLENVLMAQMRVSGRILRYYYPNYFFFILND